MESQSFQSLRNNLLIAMPSLLDINFFRTVVLIVEHTLEGAFGIILNRPLNVHLRDVFSRVIEGFTPEDLVWFGGPVEPQRGLFLHNIPRVPMKNPIELSNEIFVCGNDDTVRFLAAGSAHGLTRKDKYRFFLGYSGWGEGQLEKEIKESTWLHCLATADLILDAAPDEIWSKAIRSLGINPEALVENIGDTTVH